MSKFSDADKIEIAKQQLGDISKFDYLVFSESEYNNLPLEEEEKYDAEYEIICKYKFVIYFKYKNTQRLNR